MSIYKRKMTFIALVFSVLSLGWVACNDEDTPNDDSTETEFNSSRLPGNEAPSEYNVTPTLNTGNNGSHEMRYPVAPQDTARKVEPNNSHSTSGAH